MLVRMGEAVAAELSNKSGRKYYQPQEDVYLGSCLILTDQFKVVGGAREPLPRGAKRASKV
jgi:hypothetical protein